MICLRFVTLIMRIALIYEKVQLQVLCRSRGTMKSLGSIYLKEPLMFRTYHTHIKQLLDEARGEFFASTVVRKIAICCVAVVLSKDFCCYCHQGVETKL